MSRVQEIEAAIAELSPEEFLRVAQWLNDREQARWDEQMDEDSAVGRLDFLFDEASRKPKKGCFLNGRQ
jgi:hypothetical protein